MSHASTTSESIFWGGRFVFSWMGCRPVLLVSFEVHNLIVQTEVVAILLIMASEKTENHAFTKELELERVRLLHEHIHEGSLAYFVWLIALLIILALGNANTVGMIVWATIAVVVQLIKEHYIKEFFALDEVKHPLKREQKMAIWSFIEGLVVSAGAMMLIDFNQHLTAYLLIALIVIPAFASALVLITSVQTHFAWLLAMFLPVVIKAFMSSDSLYWVLGGLILAAGMPVSLLLGKKMNESFINGLKLRFDNLELLAIAEKANADKTRFLASASHDLRQPIHAMELFSDALENVLDKPEQFELMKKMKESSAAMSGLLSSLLDISRLDAGIVKVDKGALSAKKIIVKLIERLQPQAKLKGVEIQFDCVQSAVISDEVLLTSILQNILSNAVKYTDEGVIIVRCERVLDKVRISVEDTGIGITTDHHKSVFEEFFQAHNFERDRAKGLGLGLSIVKRSCDLLGHAIELRSELGKGSRFTIELEAADVADIVKREEMAVRDFNRLNATVLVIDDERAIREGMEKMLTPWGYEVLIVGSEVEALKKLEEDTGKIDIIISDYRLAGGKLGTDVVAAVHQMIGNDRVPAIIITGDTGPDQLKAVQAAGYHLLHKPVLPARMRTLMQNLLKNLENKN